MRAVYDGDNFFISIFLYFYFFLEWPLGDNEGGV